MPTDEGGRIGEDGRFEHFAGVHDARCQTAHGHGIDPDDLIFLIQEEHDKMLSVHPLQVCREQAAGVSRTPDPLRIAGHLSFPYQRYPVDRYVLLWHLSFLKQG